MKLTVEAASAGNEAGISNSGYWGMARAAAHEVQRVVLCEGGCGYGPLTAQLVSNDTGKVLAEARLELHAGPWSQYSFTLTTGGM